MASRLFVLDPGCDRVTGHHFAACQAVARLSPIETHIVASRKLPVGTAVEGARVHRAFTVPLRGMGGSAALNLGVALAKIGGGDAGHGHRARMAREIGAALTPFDPVAADHIVVHTTSLRVTAALTDCIEAVAPERRPSVHIRYVYRPDIFEPDQDDREAVARLGDACGLHLYADHEELCARLEDRHRGREVALLRLVHVPDSLPETREEGVPYRIAYIGASRAEKGWHELPAIVSRTNALFDAEGVAQPQFVIQALDPDGPYRTFRNRMAELRRLGAEIIEQPLSNAALSQLLSTMDVMLAPYVADAYRDRGSYVAQDCLAHGLPLAITADCTLQTYVAGGNGLAASTIEGFSQALLTMALAPDAFRARAREVADEVRAGILEGPFAQRISA